MPPRHPPMGSRLRVHLVVVSGRDPAPVKAKGLAEALQPCLPPAHKLLRQVIRTQCGECLPLLSAGPGACVLASRAEKDRPSPGHSGAGGGARPGGSSWELTQLPPRKHTQNRFQAPTLERPLFSFPAQLTSCLFLVLSLGEQVFVVTFSNFFPSSFHTLGMC